MACVCHSLAACQRHTPSSLAAVIGLSNDDIVFRYVPLRCVRCVGCLKPRYTCIYTCSHSAGPVMLAAGTTRCPKSIQDY